MSIYLVGITSNMLLAYCLYACMSV